MPRKKTPRRVGQHHGDARRALLRAALAEVKAGKAESLSLRAVARRAGLSPAAPYHHFADRHALLAAVAQDGFERLLAAQERAVSTVSEPEARLHTLVREYLRFAIAHPSHYRVMFQAPVDTREPGAGPLETAARRSFALLATHVGAVMALRGPVEEAGVRRRAVAAWALSHGTVDIAVRGLLEGLDPEFDADALAEEIADATLAVARR